MNKSYMTTKIVKHEDVKEGDTILFRYNSLSHNVNQSKDSIIFSDDKSLVIGKVVDIKPSSKDGCLLFYILNYLRLKPNPKDSNILDINIRCYRVDGIFSNIILLSQDNNIQLSDENTDLIDPELYGLRSLTIQI